MSRINQWRIYIKAKSTILTDLNVLDPAFKGSTEQKIVLVTVPTENNKRATVKLSNNSKSYATGLFNTGLTESVEVEPGVFEEWTIYESFVGNDILNNVKDFNATPVFVSFQDEQVIEFSNPNNFIYKGAYRSLPTDLTNFGDGDYIGIGVEQDRLLNQAYKFDGVSFINQDQTISEFETDNDIVIKLSIANVAQQEVPVSASTIGVTELVEVTETDLILDRIAAGEAKDAKRNAEIGVDSELVVQTDFANKYQQAVKVKTTTLLITQNPDTGVLEHATADQIVTGTVDEDKGIHNTVDEFLTDNPIANSDDGDFAGIVTPSTATIQGSNLTTTITLELVIFNETINDYIATGLTYRAGVGAIEARLTNAEQDILALQLEKSDKTDTGLFADLLQAIKDIVAASGNQTESISNSINALFPLIEAGAGDMLKAVYATLEAGKVDKAIQDSIGNVIHTFYTTKTENDLKQDKVFLANNGAGTVETAINVNTSTIGTNISSIEANDSAIAAEKIRNDDQDTELTRLDNVKIEGVLFEDDGTPTSSPSIQTINVGVGLQTTDDTNGRITIDATATGATIEAGIKAVTEPVPTTGVPVDVVTASNIASLNTDVLEINVSGNIVLNQESGYTVHGDFVISNNNINTDGTIHIEGYANGFLLSSRQQPVSQNSSALPWTPQNNVAKSEIEAVTTFPAEIIFKVWSDLPGDIEYDVFETRISAAEQTEASGNIMFTGTYDNSEIDGNGDRVPSISSTGNGVVDKVDYAFNGTTFTTSPNMETSVKELDTQLLATETKATSNASNIGTLTTTKQEKVPGDLLTTSASTSGGINENHQRLNDSDVNKVNQRVITGSAAQRDYVLIGTLNFGAGNNGNPQTNFILSGGGDFGSNSRDTLHCSIVARNGSINTVAKRMFTASSAPLELFYKELIIGSHPTYEVWMQIAQNQNNIQFTSLDDYIIGATFEVDMVTREDSMPSGLISISIEDIGDFLKDGSLAMTGNLNMDSNKITNILNPTSNQDGATKKYVDDADNILDGAKVNKIGDNMTGHISTTNTFNDIENRKLRGYSVPMPEGSPSGNDPQYIIIGLKSTTIAERLRGTLNMARSIPATNTPGSMKIDVVFGVLGNNSNAVINATIQKVGITNIAVRTVEFTYNGSTWVGIEVGTGVTGTVNQRYVNFDGEFITDTGAVTPALAFLGASNVSSVSAYASTGSFQSLAPVIFDEDLATKKYVDDEIATWEIIGSGNIANIGSQLILTTPITNFKEIIIIIHGNEFSANYKETQTIIDTEYGIGASNQFARIVNGRSGDTIGVIRWQFLNSTTIEIIANANITSVSIRKVYGRK